MKAALTALALGLTAMPALAFDPAKMNEAEKAAFGQAVKDYLMENPEVLVEAINVMEERRLANEGENDRELIRFYQSEIFKDGHSWEGGNTAGDLVMVEFIDYRCSVCKSVWEQVDETVAKDGNIKLVLKEFPILTQESELAARFAVAVKQIDGNDAYKQVHDRLMAMRGPITIASLTSLAEDLKLAPQPLIERMNGEEVSAVLRKNHQLAQNMGIAGTPTFIVGEEVMRGVPQAGVQQIIDSARADKG